MNEWMKERIKELLDEIEESLTLLNKDPKVWRIFLILRHTQHQNLVYSYEFQEQIHIKCSFHTFERESITGKPYKPYN